MCNHCDLSSKFNLEHTCFMTMSAKANSGVFAAATMWSNGGRKVGNGERGWLGQVEVILLVLLSLALRLWGTKYASPSSPSVSVSVR